ncbi:hypothetical protein EG328_003771 [Venturia inaequalis]|uniref:Uncharacterized protein n=1 Tax=Venturia inaequalis TaxID=5025 RepID=A0A8H3UTL6_VENIN|nr:hypothetical protein EG328_003771 [Venturia inaequalis]KAE9982815.1 hypothetical protein EG327_005733 [Venturia inaequalis]
MPSRILTDLIALIALYRKFYKDDWEIPESDLISVAEKVNRYQLRLSIPLNSGIVSDPMTSPPGILAKEASCVLFLIFFTSVYAAVVALLTMLGWYTRVPNAFWAGLLMFSNIWIAWGAIWFSIIEMRKAAIQNGETFHAKV